MKKRMYPILAALLAIVLLSACSSAPKTDPNVGLYKLSSIMGISAEEYNEREGTNGARLEDMMSIELKEDGTAIWKIEEEEDQELTWTVEGEILTLSDGTEDQKATIKDGEIQLTLEESITVDITFKKE